MGIGQTGGEFGGFVGYVGPPELHDATVTSVELRGTSLRVLLRTYERTSLTVVFQDVEHVIDEYSEGMIVYSLSEMEAPPPTRRFVFANWDEQGRERLEVFASGFSVSVGPACEQQSSIEPVPPLP